MSKDDLRLDIKFMMSDNLIKIIALRDDKSIYSRELKLLINYEVYDKLIEMLNNKEFSIKEMEILLKGLENDFEYLDCTYKAV